MSYVPPTSFMNLFKKIVYDKDQNANYSLDIWDSYVISPLYKNELGFFELYTLNSGDSWVSLANTFYADPRLWWVIPLFNDIEDPFTVLDENLFLDSIKQVKILKKEHLSQLLMEARQVKINNDRQTG